MYFHKNYVILQQRYNFCVRMSTATNDFLLRVKRYLHNLWDALRGREPYRKERDAMEQRLNDMSDNVEKLQGLYNSALEQWQQAQEREKAMVEHDAEKVATYQKLIETLRGTIADKERQNYELQKAYNEQLNRALKIAEQRKDNK